MQEKKNASSSTPAAGSTTGSSSTGTPSPIEQEKIARFVEGVVNLGEFDDRLKISIDGVKGTDDSRKLSYAWLDDFGTLMTERAQVLRSSSSSKVSAVV